MGALFMIASIFAVTDLTQHSATVVLAAFAAVGVLIGILYQTGLLGLILRIIFGLAGQCVRGGYQVWDRWLSSLPWYGLAGILVGLHLLRWPFDLPPLVTAFLGAALLTVGAITVLAYMFIDTERYEVSRGYKALHSPVKGQRLAEGLTRHGDRVGYALLVTAILCCISGFSLMNFGFSQSVGRDWYDYGTHPSREQRGILQTAAKLLLGPEKEMEGEYADFIAYTLINLAYLVDLLDVTNKSGDAGIAFVRPRKVGGWPASTLMLSFRLFFSMVLLQQLVSLVRHGRLLGESVQDLWSPYEPIQKRAAEQLKQQGPDAVPVLLDSIVAMSPLTGDQRQLVPQVLAEIGPATVPLLSQSLDHVNDDVRAVALASLGRMQAWWALPNLAAAGEDPSPEVRLALAEALEKIAALGAPSIRKQWALGRGSAPRRRWLRLLKQSEEPADRSQARDPIELTVAALRTLLRDPSREVRLRAAGAIAHLGAEAASTASELFDLAREDDDEIRAAAAHALGTIGGPVQDTVTALIHLLHPPVPAVLVPALKALGSLEGEASRAVTAIIPLVQHEDEEVRTAAAEALRQIGPLDERSIPQLVQDLSSPDNLERARAAQALSTIGPMAAATAPALIGSLNDPNDDVRAAAACALGKLGEEAAVESVPALARALGDPDSNVAVCAARSLGELEGLSQAAGRELRQALGHINAEVRRESAAALGKLGRLDPADIQALEPLTHDPDSNVRKQAVLTLGTLERLPESTRTVLMEALEDVDPEVRAAAVSVLARPQAGAEVVATLLHALADTSEMVRLAAVQELGELVDPPQTVIVALVRLVRESTEPVNVAAAAALGQLGACAAPAVECLREQIKIGSPALREQALRSLVQIEPADGFDIFAEALRDPAPSLRRLASAGLIKLKELPEETLPLLADGLRDPDPQVCANMAHVCSRLDSVPAEVVPILLTHATAPDDGLRLNALRALRKLPVGNGEAILPRLLEDENLQIALQAAIVLLTRDPKREGLDAVLARALEAGVLFREQALNALAQCEAPASARRALMERLWERVNHAEVREQLTKLLAECEVPESAPAGTQGEREA